MAPFVPRRAGMGPAALLLPLLGLTAALGALPAFAQQGRAAVVRERLRSRPEDPTLHYDLAAFEFAEGNESAGVAALKQVARLGHGFLPAKGVGFEVAWERPAFVAVRAELERKLPRVRSRAARPSRRSTDSSPTARR